MGSGAPRSRSSFALSAVSVGFLYTARPSGPRSVSDFSREWVKASPYTAKSLHHDGYDGASSATHRLTRPAFGPSVAVRSSSSAPSSADHSASDWKVTSPRYAGPSLFSA